MQKFIDLITSLFPNWNKSHKLFCELPLECSPLEQTKTKKKAAQTKWISSERNIGSALNSSTASKAPSFSRKKSPLIIKNKYRRRSLDSMVSAENRGIKQKLDVNISKISGKSKKKVKFNRTRSIDFSSTLHSFNVMAIQSLPAKFPIVTESIEKYRKNMKNGSELKQFVENLQSYKAGNINDTSATKFPKVCEKEGIKEHLYDPPIDFDKEIKCYRRTLLQEEFNKFKSTEESVSLESEFDKIRETISSLKLKAQQLTSG